MRLAAWRGNREVLIENAKPFASRGNTIVGAILKVVRDLEHDATINHEYWDQLLNQPSSPERPARQGLIRLQILVEIALLLGDRKSALDALDRAVAHGLMDLTWMDGCPLMEPVSHDQRYRQLRRIVADRAAKVLA